MRPSDPRLRAMLAPARAGLAGVVAAGVLGGLVVIAQAWAVAGLVVAVLRDEPLGGWMLAVVGVLVLRALTGAAADLCAARAAAVVGTVLRHRLVRAYVDRAGAAEAPGAAAVLATRGVAAAEPYVTRYVPALVVATVLPPLTVVAIATQDLLSAVIVLATLPLVPVFGALVGLATRDRAEEQWRAMASLSGHFLDVVRGLPTLVVHRRARAQSGRIAEVTDRYRRASLRTLRIAFASSAVLELVATLSVALVAVTVGVRLASGSIGLPTALVVLLLAPEAYWPLRRVGAEFHAAAEGAATFTEAHDLLAAGPADATGATDTPAPLGATLVLDGVAVTYPGRTAAAVAGVSALVPARGVTALVGPSGCGKSTVLAAVAGLLPSGAVTSGTIAAGGRPVRGPSWQAQVAWLPQQPRFVAGSVADNLRLSRPDADDDDLWSVLREVALEERVRALPQGLATPLGEDGATLSAGERARLALARVVLADRPWVLLDEPTAHLDDLTEQVIADTIVALGRRSGVLVVAHRPRLVGLADHRIVLPAPAPALAPAATSGPVPAGAPAPAPVPLAADTPLGGERRMLAGAAVVGALASASGVALTATAGWLIVQASTRPAVLTLLVAVVGVRAFGLARPVLRYVERLRSHDAALRLLARRRVEVYDALVPLVPGRLGRRRGDVLTSVVDDVDSVVDRQLRVRMPLVQLGLVGVLATAVATLLHPPAGPVVAATGLTGAVAFLVARHGARGAERRLVALRAELSASVVEAVQVADELRMWQRAVPTADRVAATSARMGAVATTAARWLTAARAVVLVGCGVAVAATAAVSAGAVAHGTLAGPVMALLVLLPLALADVALPAADAGLLAARTAAADDRLRALEHTAPAVPDLPGRATARGHDLALDALTARWETRAPLIRPVTLDLGPGDRVAVVGPSGSGKSTLAAVLLRFLDPAGGTAALGGAPLEDLALDDVRRQVGLVDDHPHVFATTVAENVRLARPGASDAEVERALRQAHLGAWLDALPDGLGTWLGTGHANVSGGERARLGVARSLLADQPVLVLDEPTAHLDHATAVALAAEVLGGDRDRSVLWITHTSAGLDLVDRTVVLDGPEGAEGPGRSRASARGPQPPSGGRVEP
ncbi:thiol reductant ABC exporter subunit CydD [Pimelobacter simplex]|uniref:Transport ATP-binding protein CydCD n=1 Tax=Nocardioides simplex TaxID=2045 RepID=A0A0A1DMU4_NOCSI|nr:thiol reductant ABC exporter subunit CydD [Pimelobacter simplex]AIY17932.1 Transport ATP-binding protein CydCD [Pimelobacter simplex]MCG8152669.1 thiol reductant ABC exporter subunit CydD [Pimelobacter simplex]GEB16955.1 glutathione/cysteine ABC transporter permease/ATPase [Pimelobacter simplex]SFM75176.1 ATP-binding cassette, subfamily C, CydCD [Pimelobacter simplex]